MNKGNASLPQSKPNCAAVAVATKEQDNIILGNWTFDTNNEMCPLGSRCFAITHKTDVIFHIKLLGGRRFVEIVKRFPRKMLPIIDGTINNLWEKAGQMCSMIYIIFLCAGIIAQNNVYTITQLSIYWTLSENSKGK